MSGEHASGARPEQNKRDFIARNVLPLLKKGDLVNLGAGIPSLLANYIDEDSGMMVQTECGTIGGGPLAKPEEVQVTLIAPDTRYSTLRYDGICFDSQTSFCMIRGGHLDVTVLGALQVDREGSMANWDIPGKALKGMGGAMDLCVGAKTVIVAMEHCTKDGQPKIVERCDLPLTCKGEVDYIVTELAVLQVTPDGLAVMSIAPGVTVEELQAKTGTSLIIPASVAVMAE